MWLRYVGLLFPTVRQPASGDHFSVVP